MRNLFVVNTPFQLLSSYILATSILAADSNDLLLLHPHGYARWSENPVLAFLSSDKSTWGDIFVEETWANRGTKLTDFPRQIKVMRDKLLAAGPIGNVYVGSDRLLQNQLIVELAGKQDFIRLDEGLGSYFSEDTRSAVSKLWQTTRIKFLRLTSGLNTGMEYNVGSLGSSKAGKADYLYKPELLRRHSPQVIPITKDAISKAKQKLVPFIKNYPQFNEKCILFLSSPLVELGICTYSQEKAILSAIVETAHSHGYKLIYKPHPAEKSEKMRTYRQELPMIEYFDSIEPVEVLYGVHSKIKAVLGYMSSGMVYCDLFAEHKILRISLLKLYNIQDDIKNYAPLLNKAGIHVIDNLGAIGNLIMKVNDDM